MAALPSLGPAAAAAQVGWELAPDPTVTVGAIDGPPESMFHDVRGAIALDGMIVVADGASGEIRVFSEAGEFVVSFGSPGDGPREFRSVQWLDTCGSEAIVVYDHGRHRLTQWTPDGTLLSEVTVQGTRGDLPPYSVDCGPTGQLAIIGWPDVLDLRVQVGRIYRPDVTIGVGDAHGQVNRILGVFPGPERYRSAANDRPHPLGKTTVARMGADAVYIGTADSFAIDIIRLHGEHSRLRRDYPPTRLTDRMRELWADSYTMRWPAERRAALKRDLLESDAWPTALPAYSGFQLDRLGYVWVSKYEVPDRQSAQWEVWEVFDPDGQFVASVEVPRYFRPTDIGESYVLGVSSDPMSVQTVSLYRLSR